MIRLTRINQARFYLNSDLIEFIDSIPDTLITTVNGTKVLVTEEPEEVVRRVVEFRRAVLPPASTAEPVQRLDRA